MKKVRAAIVGYGNIGHYVLEALQAAPDFEIAGVVRRAGAENKPEELANYAVVKDIKELEGVEVAILCTQASLTCAARWMPPPKSTKPYPSSPQDGIREATRSYAPCSKQSLRKASLTPTSVPA